MRENFVFGRKIYWQVSEFFVWGSRVLFVRQTGTDMRIIVGGCIENHKK